MLFTDPIHVQISGERYSLFKGPLLTPFIDLLRFFNKYGKFNTMQATHSFIKTFTVNP